MKAKIKIAILVLIIIVLSGVYSVIDKKVSIYDTKCDNSKYLKISLDEGNSVSQKFLCSEEKLDGMAMKISVADESKKNQIELNYKLIDVETNEIIEDEVVDLSELKSGKFFQTNFETINNCKDKEYLFVLQIKKCVENSVTVYYTKGEAEKTSLTYNEDKVDGTMVCRTITHRFDIETFVVTLCFIAYIILFMRWLNKLFK